MKFNKKQMQCNMKKVILCFCLMPVLTGCDWWVDYSFKIKNTTNSELKIVFESMGEDFHNNNDNTNSLTEFSIKKGETRMVRHIMGGVNGSVENIIADGIPIWLKLSIYKDDVLIDKNFNLIENWMFTEKKHSAEYLFIITDEMLQ